MAAGIAVLSMGALAAAAAAQAPGGRGGGPGGGAPALSTATQEQGMRAGLPFADPPDLTVPAGGALKLTAKLTRFDLSGRKVYGDSYNGKFVGPTVHLAPGQTTTLAFRNRLPVVSNLHFHGLHVSPEGSSDNVFLDVSPGKSFAYHLAIPANHPLGTFWYHDHDMGMSASVPGTSPTATTGSDVESEIEAGLSGTILIGDDRTLLPPALRHITAHTMVFKDAQISAAGRIVQNTSGQGGLNSRDPTVRLVNGQLRPTVAIKPGETQLWRLANEGADIFYRLKLAGMRFTVIAHDGVPVPRITAADELLLAPGTRDDVLVTAPRSLGTHWLSTLRYRNGTGGDVYPTVRMLAAKVAGPAQTPAAMPTGAMPTAPADLSTAEIAQRRTLTLTDGGPTMYINGKTFDDKTSIFSTPGVTNTVEEWTIVNTTGDTHPFHLHTNQFQVMSTNGAAQPYTNVADVVPVPSHGRVVIRVNLADFTGRWMFHCHIAAHEVQGMMSYLNVVAAS